MNRFQFREDEPEEPAAARWSRTAVRMTGIVLLAVGLLVALMTVAEAWGLYGDPARIERLARAIEKGSNLDAALASRHAADADAAPRGPIADDLSAGQDPAPALEPPDAHEPQVRLSYFAAWIVAILLLLLIGRLGIAFIRAGCELALYDLRLKQIQAREAAAGK
ncbi:MAG: hypothetical protein AB7Q97_10085 [Gammaproteobacteria bacterium]